MTQQKRLSDWFHRHGGKVTVNRAAVRASEEMTELLESVSVWNSETPPADCLEEVADVYLCLLLVADLLGGDLHEAAERKMDKNDARTWRVDETGALYHVKESKSS